MHARIENLVLAVTFAFGAMSVAAITHAAGKAGATSSGGTTHAASKGQSPAATASRSGSMQSTRSGGNAYMYGTYSRGTPELDPTRRISAQDCTKPLVEDGANLRCK